MFISFISSTYILFQEELRTKIFANGIGEGKKYLSKVSIFIRMYYNV